MTYKSLLSVVTDTALAEAPLDHMIALAKRLDSHCEVMCMGVDRTQTGYYYAGANAMILQETLSRASTEAVELEDLAKKRFSGFDGRWNTDNGVAQIADLGRHVAYHARFNDLVVLPQPYGRNRGAECEPVVEAAMFEGQAPVLVVPDAVAVKDNFDTVLVGWNESAEALNAIRRALPFLQMAKVVRIVVVDPPRHGPDRSDPGGMLSQMLARHGVKCEIDVLSKTMTRISDVLNRHISDTAADLLVMGAYGHSRFREAVLGGATRYMLEQAEIPVFMAH